MAAMKSKSYRLLHQTRFSFKLYTLMADICLPADSNRHDEDQLDDLENEILHLSEDVEGRSDDQSPSQLVFDSRSPKRCRPSLDCDSPDIYDLEIKINEENGEDFEQPPKKPCRTSCTNQRVEAHDVLLMELEGRRASKQSPSRTPAKGKIKSRKPRQSKKTPRSLHIDELVVVPEIFDGSDAEDDGSMKSDHTT